MMNLEHLASVLALHISDLAPSGFSVVAADGMLWYATEPSRERRMGTHIRDNFGLYGDSDEENIIGLAVLSLGEFQDFVSEETGSPWPGATHQPPPYGRINNARLEIGYESDEGTPVACTIIPLSEFR
jgi:hypothetical protein